MDIFFKYQGKMFLNNEKVFLRKIKNLNALPYWFFLHIFENYTFFSPLFSAVHLHMTIFIVTMPMTVSIVARYVCDSFK